MASAHGFIPRRFRLLVFDWDGTLADSTSLIATCLQHACAEMGVAVPSDRDARHVIGLGLQDALQYVAPELPVERYSELALYYRNHYLARDPAIALFPGARELLQELKGAGYWLGVATGKSRHGLERALEQQGLADFFTHTRCADESPPKPDPDMLHCLMRVANVSPGETLMIGDTTHDVRLARNAGAAALAVSYGAHGREEFVSDDGVEVVHSVVELRCWLELNG